MGEYVSAIQDFTKAIDLNSEDVDYYYNRGRAFYFEEYYKEAILDYTNAIKLNPKDDYTYNNRGLAYWKRGLFNGAMFDFTKAIDLNPKNIDAYNRRAYLYITVKNDNTHACADWKKACELGDCENYYLAQKNGTCE